MAGEHIPETTEQVLSTLNRDGSRRWIRPKLARGAFYKRRVIVAWSLIIAFAVIPYLKMNGKPLMLFDIPRRQFTLFGTTFLATDTVFLMLLLVGIFIGIFLLTALFGRVWCGWACPQTVYMEFLYRPIERLIEGGRAAQLRMDRHGGGFRRLLKYPVFLLLSAFVAHVFLAYFVGVETLLAWVRKSPAEHPTAFVIMAGVTLLMFLDFAYFREQVCIVACPYGRLQSVLLDRSSLIVGYDDRRGEPRGRARDRRRADEGSSFGDCIDCSACVTACPTGIDIRDGLQLECIGCTQCIDACDAIMDRVGKPRGLVRYSSREALQTGRSRLLRPRVVIYPLILALVFGLLGISLARKQDADITLLRGLGAPYTTLADGRVSNQIRIKVVNRAETQRSFLIELLDLPQAEVVAPENPLDVRAGKTETTAIFVSLPRDAFIDGQREIVLRVTDGADFDQTFEYRLLGPES